MIRGGAVPVPLARRGVDGVAGPDLGDLAAAGLDQPDSLGDVQGLPAGVRVPRIAGARREPYHVDANPGGLLASRDHVVPGITGERLRWGLHAGLFRQDLQSGSPSGVQEAGVQGLPGVPA